MSSARRVEITASLALGLLVLWAAPGCRSDTPAADRAQPAAQARRTQTGVIPPPEAAPRPTPEAGPARVGPAPAATVPGIWAQITDERARLAAAIHGGRLGEAAPRALATRDLVLALVHKAGTSSPIVAPRLDSLGAEVRTTADHLARAANARDARATEADYNRLVDLLAALEAVTNGHTTSE